ncbi:GDSL-type esterase/lipase family protein [Pontibacter sp. E15-1]|uniref:GDSL-type esterase/lipase family protein n=1 Tax=Pontibacter sp. E15-1 TaxID=2919918 RepID=UPI001F4F7D3D|nr:GDSL-type esterase/lipase family protein [Pontibacter sp. E15-1]MCJ8165880.1 GDSL-type esterase/lipase family protein [Pontibacter sp. E15-1]
MKRMVSIGLVALLMSFFHVLPALAQAKIKVACVGNSITEGASLTETYPQKLQKLLGEEYEVRNYGIGGRTLLKKGDFPYWKEAKYADVLAWNPDIVLIKLGTNDSKPQNWQYKDEFVRDYKKFVKSFKKLPADPQVYVCYPVPVFEDKWGINEAVVKNEVLPAVKKIARKTRVKTIDLYTPFLGKGTLTKDGIHPNDEGAALIAREVYKALQATHALSVSAEAKR